MDISLCYNANENNVIGKKITTIKSVTGILKQDCSIYNPVIILNTDINMNKINYLYIPSFSRYYFIDNITALTGGRYEITARVDTLESFKTSILKLTCTIDKQEKLYNNYIDDGSFVIENRSYNTILNFPDGFNDAGEFILITAGG